jgi:Flp pilus assembly protein TadD
VGAALAAWLNRGRGTRPTPQDPFPLPPYSESRFLNTGPDAHYVGTAACAECHPGNHRSYLLTPHSRSLAEPGSGAEPPDGSFYHQPSGRSYRVYRRDKQLRHEEVLRTAEGREIARVDLPVRYRVGSGNFTRTYLVESDGFLHESPITWYASTHKWGMSPGYDFPQHWGFDRPVVAECVACHAGRAEAADGTLHRITFHERVIGCENCHGPGSLHEALRRGGGPPPGEEDWTIINPGKLSRPLQEAVCAACHLNGPATVPLRGRRPGDFRPGRPLTDYRIDYRFAGGDEQMTVVGHVAQLRRSACYQKSEGLTCLTCHDPHAKERPKGRAAFYRQRCLNCHDVQSCGLKPDERLQRDAADNCVACHMPRGDTEIPHIAFTNHRIARRPPPRPADLGPGHAPPASPSGQAPELVPTDDDSHLAPLDRRRNLGLAYYAAFRDPVNSRHGYAETFWERARGLLEAVDAAGLHEPETAAALAELYWGRDRDSATAYARLALQAPGISVEARIAALLVLAGAEMQDGEFDAASRRLEELVRLRRAADDWYFLGVCYLRMDQPSKALAVLRQALAIRPDRFAVHGGLAEAYRRLGDARRSNEHQEKSRWLFHNRRD